MKLSISLLLLIAISASAVMGKCPNPSVPSNFNTTRYLGMWHEIAVAPIVRETFERDCDPGDEETVIPASDSTLRTKI